LKFSTSAEMTFLNKLTILPFYKLCIEVGDAAEL
jgi:hypothetical protein